LFTEGTVTKCTFCAHRVDQGLLPACVVTCPTDARIFGDLDDPESAPSVLIRERNGKQPLPEMGTNPSVYYVE
jgi:molybdopterin-containing oxidoreductase family iron-sulfur binding subunit